MLASLRRCAKCKLACLLSALGSKLAATAAAFSLLVSTMPYRDSHRNGKDSWEKKRMHAVKRLNRSIQTSSRPTQPHPWTLQYYLLEWCEFEWHLQSLPWPIRSTEDRLRYAAEHEWSIHALRTELIHCLCKQSGS